MSRITLGKLFSRTLMTEVLSTQGGPLNFGSPLISYNIAMGKKEKDCGFLSTKFWSKL